MAFVETERHGQIFIVRLNRPERMNAMGSDLRQGMAEAFSEFRTNDDLEVAIFTGTGRAYIPRRLSCRSMTTSSTVLGVRPLVVRV